MTKLNDLASPCGKKKIKSNLCHAIFVQNIVVILDMRKRMVLGPKTQIYAMPSTGKTVEALDMRKRKVLALKKPLLSWLAVVFIIISGKQQKTWRRTALNKTLSSTQENNWYQILSDFFCISRGFKNGEGRWKGGEGKENFCGRGWSFFCETRKLQCQSTFIRCKTKKNLKESLALLWLLEKVPLGKPII